jgi:AraC family transcriptional regulator, ethanolamine operon transcriptional activator
VLKYSPKLYEHGRKAYMPQATPTTPNTTLKMSRVEFRNSDELGEHYDRATVRFLQMAKGPYRATWQTATVGPLYFSEVGFTLGTLIEGTTSPDITHLIFSDAPAGTVIYTGHKMGPGEIMLYGAGTEHFSAASNRRSFNISLPKGMLEAELAARLNLESYDITKTRKHVRIGTAAIQELQNVFVETSRLATEETGVHTPEAIQQLTQLTLSRVCTAMLRESQAIGTDPRQTQSPATILVKARQVLEAAGTRPIYIGEVCKETGVSARTLQMVFASAVGMSPMRYLKIRRLNLVRRRLMTTPRDQLSIKQAAREGGFWDDGHFSSDYFRLFGILPSHTPRP